MAEKEATPQQPVISIRISEALRTRLEAMRTLMAIRNGQAASTSEAAKHLLESAKEERLDLVNLIGGGTGSLYQIRQKIKFQFLLSRAEWALIAYYCLQGSEVNANPSLTEIQQESLAGMLEAFQAVYALRGKREMTSLDAFFISHLPADRKTAPKAPEKIGSADVERVVTQTLRALKNPLMGWQKPVFIARNLYFLLDELEFSNVKKLNETLRPYWPILWRVCARGHYLLYERPIRDPEPPPWDWQQASHPPLPPSFQQGGYCLEFSRSPGEELCARLSLPGKYRTQYPVSGYPKISELRAMLQRLDLGRERNYWEGRHFLAYTGADENDVIGVNLRARDNGITFNFQGDDWKAIRNLFRRAWLAPETGRLWDELALEYGEI